MGKKLSPSVNGAIMALSLGMVLTTGVVTLSLSI
eukprot:gene38420-13524_t